MGLISGGLVVQSVGNVSFWEEEALTLNSGNIEQLLFTNHNQDNNSSRKENNQRDQRA